MTSHQNSVKKGKDDLNAIEEAPPTFEEAVAADNDKQCGSKKKFTELFHFTKKKDNKDIDLEDLKNKDDIPEKKDIIVQEVETEETEERAVVICCRKFVDTLKLMSACITVVSDIGVWACGLALLILGCMIQEKKFELVKTLLSYHDTFRIIAHFFIGLGIIYTLVLAPLGVIGSLRRKRRCLKIHNLGLLLNLIVQGFILYMLYRRVYKDKEPLESFKTNMARYLKQCRVKLELKPIQCCCFKTDLGKLYAGNQTDKLCWEYKADTPYPTDEQKQIEYLEDCEQNKDQYPQIQTITKKAYYYLPFFMVIQAIALFFGWLVRKGIPEDVGVEWTDSEEAVVQVKLKNMVGYRAKSNLFYRVFLAFVVKRAVFYIFLGLITLAGWEFIKYARTKKIWIEKIHREISLWDIIQVVMGRNIDSK